MNKTFINHDKFAEMLDTATVIDLDFSDYDIIGKEQSGILKELALSNKKRIREGGVVVHQLEVRNIGILRF